MGIERERSISICANMIKNQRIAEYPEAMVRRIPFGVTSGHTWNKFGGSSETQREAAEWATKVAGVGASR